MREQAICGGSDVNIQTTIGGQLEPNNLSNYLDTLGKLERMHRLLLDVVKDEFERLGIIDINSVQGLLLFNIGEQEMAASDLRTRGYYQGSNASYNLNKLVKMGYIHHNKCEVDRRMVRISLTEKGTEIRRILHELFTRHAEILTNTQAAGKFSLENINSNMRVIERFWSEQIQFIY